MDYTLKPPLGAEGAEFRGQSGCLHLEQAHQDDFNHPIPNIRHAPP